MHRWPTTRGERIISGQTLRPHRASPGFVSRALMILLAVWALAIITPELYRVIAPLSSIGLSADNDGTVLNVKRPFDRLTDSPAARAGIVPGDQLDLKQMHCKEPLSENCTGVVTVLGDFGGVQYTLRSDQITLLIVPLHGGPPVKLHIRPSYAALRWHSRLGLLADTVVGSLFVSVAFYLVWTRPSRMTWGFFLYAIWFNPGEDYAFYSLLQTWTPAVLIEQVLEAFAQGAAYAGLLAFALCFPGETVEPRWQRLDAALPWLGAMIAALTLLSGANLFGFQTEVISRIHFFAIIPLDSLAILLLVLRLRHLPPQDEERMRWAIAGCVIGLPAFLVAELCQSSGLPYALFGVTPSETLIELLYLFHGVIAYFVGTAIRRRRVISVTIPLRRGAILTVLTFILGVPIVYLHDKVSFYGDSLNERFHLPEWIWLLVVSPIALIALTQMHHHAVELTERAFNRRYHRARDALRESAQRALSAKTFADVDRLLADVPMKALRLSSAAVFRSVDGTLQRCSPAIGWPETGIQTLDRSLDALPLTCLATGRPQRLPRGNWHRPGLPADDEAPCLALPVHGGATESVAILLLGTHVTGGDITPDEKDLLHAFTAQAALGYDHVEVETLRREVQTLRMTGTAPGAAITTAGAR